MSGAAPCPARRPRGDSRAPQAARAAVVVVAWHVLPACEVILGNIAVAREAPGDSFAPLILSAHEFLLAGSLLISMIIFGALIALGRRRPRLRRAWVLGNASAGTGIVLSLVSIAWIYLWLTTLASLHQPR